MSKKRRKILVFGNLIVKEDSLPLRILPKLRKRFPEIQFIEADPTELLDYNGDFWILDTAEGIDDVIIFNDISKLTPPRRVGVHDYDLALDLKLLSKLGKLEKVRIIALPIEMEHKEAFRKVVAQLRASGF